MLMSEWAKELEKSFSLFLFGCFVFGGFFLMLQIAVLIIQPTGEPLHRHHNKKP